LSYRDDAAALRGGLRPLLEPRSLALVGASDRQGAQWALVENAKRGGVEVWPVNPSRAEVLGLRCHPSVAALPGAPDVVLLAVGHERVEQAFADAVEAGCRTFVLPGLGNEAGHAGPPVAAAIAARAAETGAAVLGPNCMGIAIPGGASCWLGTLPQTFSPGRVAVVTQSGSSRAFSAVLRRFGALEIDDFPELVETLEVLGRRRVVRGTRIAAISESGGEAALLADAAEAAGIPFAPLQPALADALRAEFPNYRSPDNPLDAWAVDAVEKVFPRSLELLARSGEFDILVAQVDHSQFRGSWEQDWTQLIVRALADAV